MNEIAYKDFKDIRLEYNQDKMKKLIQQYKHLQYVFNYLRERDVLEDNVLEIMYNTYIEKGGCYWYSYSQLS